MSEPKAPKIEFPCDYVIKVIGNSAPDFTEFVVEVVEQHAPGITDADVSVNKSSGGRFSSVQLKIVATGEAQLKALFEDLKASGRVHMVL
ncbi:HP0495 family protein [Marinobacter sp. DUT-3]|uniref:HP0495 family protein n=1 Tax=unclassified Marinobacter TaxID=83889 RepID=UPI00387B2256